MANMPDNTDDTLSVIYEYTQKQARYYSRRAFTHNGYTIEYDEILSAFHISLSKCLQKYDAQKEASLKTYGSSALRNAFKNILRDQISKGRRLGKAFSVVDPLEGENNPLEKRLGEKHSKFEPMTLAAERAAFRPMTRKVIRVPGGRNQPAEDEDVSNSSEERHKNLSPVEIAKAISKNSGRKLRTDVRRALEAGEMTVNDWLFGLTPVRLRKIREKLRPLEAKWFREELDKESDVYDEPLPEETTYLEDGHGYEVWDLKE